MDTKTNSRTETNVEAVLTADEIYAVLSEHVRKKLKLDKEYREGHVSEEIGQGAFLKSLTFSFSKVEYS